MPTFHVAKEGERKPSREELEQAIEDIKDEVWKPGQTMAKLKHAIAIILQDLKGG